MTFYQFRLIRSAWDKISVVKPSNKLQYEEEVLENYNLQVRFDLKNILRQQAAVFM